MTTLVTKKLMLFFPQCECEKPITYHLVKDYDLVVNIFRAKVTPEESGYLVLDVTGTEENIAGALEYITTFDVTINQTTDALHVSDRGTMAVAFDEEKCIECLACIRVCLYGACASAF